MNFKKVNIYIDDLDIELLMYKIIEIGVTGFEVNSKDDFIHFLEDKNKKWDYIDDKLMFLKDIKTSITFYLPCNEQGESQLKDVRKILIDLKGSLFNFDNINIEIDDVKEEDWANNWKKYFKPMEIGENLVIKPSWETYNNEKNKIILEIDPNSSFGTGQHETTKLCLEVLQKIVKNEDVVLDMGCGSGILSVASFLLGAKNVTGVDIEQNSIMTSFENIGYNNIDKNKFKGYVGDITKNDDIFNNVLSIDYDVVVANIVSDVLISLSDILIKCTKKSGKLALSGIIKDRLDEVKNLFFKKGLTLKSEDILNDWCCLVFIK
ncbi:MAG: 50S ribosomal protein L11 methyltransferase [Oscillospiraceae bacterium]